MNSSCSIKILNGSSVCLYKENNVPRSIGLVIMVFAILENLFLLAAIIVHWSKFLSNMYRYVTSLVCAEILVASTSLVLQVLKFYPSGLYTLGIIRGLYVASHITSITSTCLVNVSVFFTYSRFSTRLLEQQNEEDALRHSARMREWFRRPSVAYFKIIIIWLITGIAAIIGILTQCKEAYCDTNCTTVIRGLNGTEEGPCMCNRKCTKLLAPLGLGFVVVILAISWITFLLLIFTTIVVVFVRVTVKPAPKSTDAANEMELHNEQSNIKEDVTKVDSEGISVETGQTNTPDDDVDQTSDYNDGVSHKQNIDERAEKETEIDENERVIKKESGKLSTGGSVGKKASQRRIKRKQSVHYAIKRKFGFNRDLMSRFSLLTTVAQSIFWLPATGILTYIHLNNKIPLSYVNYEIAQIFFTLPTIIQPWICVLTMSKLRDALFHAYYNLCH